MTGQTSPGALPPDPHHGVFLYEMLTAPQESGHGRLAVRAALAGASLGELWDAWDECLAAVDKKTINVGFLVLEGCKNRQVEIRKNLEAMALVGREIKARMET